MMLQKSKFFVAGALALLSIMTIGALAFAKARYSHVQYSSEEVPASSAQRESNSKPDQSNNDVEKSGQPEQTNSTENYPNLFELYIYGVDSRNNTTLDKGANSDTIIVCQMCPATGEVRLISVMRDTFVMTPDGKRGKINGYYCKSGAAETSGILNDYIDLSIRKFVTVNWKSVAEAIDKIGGIDLYLSSAELNNLNRQIVETSKVTGIPCNSIENAGDGVYHLNGVQAVGHARNRQVGKHDEERTRRQRDILSAILVSAQKLSAPELIQIADETLMGVMTNVSFEEIVSLIPLVTKCHVTVTESFPFHYRMQLEGSWYVYPETLESNVTILHSLLYPGTDYEPSDHTKEISANVSAYANENP